MGLKAHQNKEAGVKEDAGGDNVEVNDGHVEKDSEEPDDVGLQVIADNTNEEALEVDVEVDVREELEGELPDIPEHGNGPEISIEGEPVAKNVEKQKKTKPRSKKKADKQPTRPTSKRMRTRPLKFMDSGEVEEEEEEERVPKRQRSITSQIKSQLERFHEENETVPILIEQLKNKASFLAGFEKIFSSPMD